MDNHFISSIQTDDDNNIIIYYNDGTANKSIVIVDHPLINR